MKNIHRIFPSLSGTQDYLHSLGKARTAQVQKDARIGEAKNKRDAVIRVRYITLSPAIPMKVLSVSFQYKHPLCTREQQDVLELSLF